MKTAIAAALLLASSATGFSSSQEDRIESACSEFAQCAIVLNGLPASELANLDAETLAAPLACPEHAQCAIVLNGLAASAVANVDMQDLAALASISLR